MQCKTVSSILLFLLLFMGGCAADKPASHTAAVNSGEKLINLGNGICQDTSTGLMWTEEKSDAFASWKEASAYADRLELGGYNDWRLPSRKELHRLHDIFFWEKNGACLMQSSGSYWCGTQENDAAAGYWETYFLCSPEYRFIETPGKGMVRAVRP